jgi:L-fuculose-phosphate aldolase
MNRICAELVRYGRKIVQANLVAGAGGNISARDGRLVWMKPSGFAMDEMAPGDMCGLELAGGRQVRGRHRPTSEYNMHLAIYRVRPEVMAIFHTHSPWAAGVISAGIRFRPMFAEFINDLGRTGVVPYITPTTRPLAEAMALKAKTCDTIFMVNHGVLAVGVNMKQAYFRCVVVEDAAKSLVAAACVGKPKFLTPAQGRELMAQAGPQHRLKMMQAENC